MGQAYPAVAECDRPRHEVYVLTDLARSAWDPEQPRRGARPGREGRRRARRQDRHLRPPADAQGDPRRRRRSRPSRRRPWRRRASRSRSGPGPVAGRQAGEPGGRVLARRRQEGARSPSTVSRPTARSRSSFIDPPSSTRTATLHQRRGPAQRQRPTRSSSTTSGSSPSRSSRRSRSCSSPTRRSTPSSSPPRSTPTRARRRTHDRSRSSGSGPRDFVGRSIATRSATTRASSCSTSRQLDDAAWGLLNGYVREGGGLVVGLGDRCRAENYNGPIASQLLPAAARRSPVPQGGRRPSARSPTSPTRSSALSQGARAAARADAGLSLLVGQAPRRCGCSHAPDLRRRRPRAASSGRSRGRRPAGSCSGPPRWLAAPTRTDRGAWNEFPLPTSAGSSWPDEQTVPYLAGTAERAAELRGRRGRPCCPSTRPRGSRTTVVTGPDAKTTGSAQPPGDQRLARDRRARRARPVDGDGHGRRERARPGSASASTRPRPRPSSPRSSPSDLDALFGKDGYALADDAKSLEELIERRAASGTRSSPG